MDRYKTLSRQDPDFKSYLDGSFSNDYIALPTRSMNIATSREEVTFEIVPVIEIKSPSLAKIVWTVARPASLVLSLGPAVACVALAVGIGASLPPASVLPALAAILFFHLSMNVLDDYFDHRRGIDRLNPQSGSRAIQNGWVRGATMLRAGLGLMAFSVLLGLPILLGQPLLLLVAALFALLIGWGFSSLTARLKYRGFGELTTFILSGPLLTVGFSWACLNVLGWPVFLMGCAFGFTTVFYYHLKNIENIMLDSQAGAPTLASRLGFDSSKILVWVFAALSGLSILVYDWAMDTHGYFISVFAVHALVLIPVARQLTRAPSPLSSNLREVKRRGLQAHWLTAAAFVLANLLLPLFFGSPK